MYYYVLYHIINRNILFNAIAMNKINYVIVNNKPTYATYCVITRRLKSSSILFALLFFTNNDILTM